MTTSNDVNVDATVIKGPNGDIDAMFYAPGTGKWPGVLLLTDIAGIRPAQEDMAKRLAAEGYVVLMPNIFHRARKPPVFDFPAKWGDERTMARFAELSGSLPPDAMDKDGALYVSALVAHPSCRGGRVGVVGYCFSVAMAMRTAASVPDQVAAVAGFHGGRLLTDAPTSPHLVLPRIKARLYFGHAANDQSMPADAIERLDRALQAWGGSFETEVYDEARHGWTVPDNPVYNEPQAERAFRKLTAFFGETLA